VKKWLAWKFENVAQMGGVPGTQPGAVGVIAPSWVEALKIVCKAAGAGMYAVTSPEPIDGCYPVFTASIQLKPQVHVVGVDGVGPVFTASIQLKPQGGAA